ncbi:hypothetical protein JCM10213v2_002692 [Rhodosporidiobolus nylandii]
MFSRSYETSHTIEQRLSSPAAPLQSSAARTRNIPAELRAPAPSSDLFGPLETLELATAARADSVTHAEEMAPSTEEEGDETLIGMQHELATELADTASNKPCTTSQGSPRSKRLSLPNADTAASSSSSASSLSAASTTSLLTKRTSLPSGSSSGISRSSSRKSTSPSHAAGRRVLSVSLPSSSAAARDGTLLAFPVAKQLHELRTRNASLTKQQADATAKLAKAAERIKQLEDAQESRQMDAEGWEAEALRLQAELAAANATSASTSAAPPVGGEGEADLAARVCLLERELRVEQAKRRRAKEMQAKMRCELVNRRWKEKWEVELLEREERAWEIKVVELEAELVRERWEKECERAEKEELQETFAAASKRISTLSASRQLLLTSFATSESTISTLRAELASARRELDAALSAAQELRGELDNAKQELETAEKGEKKSLETKGKEAEKEKLRRGKVETELKELKSQLKTAQSALKASESAASSATAAAEEAQTALADLQASTARKEKALEKERDLALARSSSTVKAISTSSAAKKRPAPVEDEREHDEGEEHHPYAAPSPAPVKEAPMKARKPRAPKKLVVEEPEEPTTGDVEAEPLQEEEEETYKPKKSKSRSSAAPNNKLKAPTAVKAKKAKKAAEPESEVEADEVEPAGAVEDHEPEQDDERTPRPVAKVKAKQAPAVKEKVAPAPAAEEKQEKSSKKRKASVLGDKSANSSLSSLSARNISATAEGVEASGAQLKIKKKAAASKKLVLSDDEDQPAAAKADEPAKKKQKIKLFGAKKKFEWGGAENANLGLTGIPLDLSPIKVAKPKKASILAGLGGGAKKGTSIFG